MKKETLRRQIAEKRSELNKLRESRLTGLAVLVESELDKASLLLSASAITDRLQDIAEKIAKIEPDELMKMDDAMRAQMGEEMANRFYEKSVSALRTLVDAVKVARDAIANEIEGLRTGEIPNDMMNAPDVSMEPEMDDEMDDADDDFELPDSDLSADIEDDDAEPVVKNEPALGRERKLQESKSLDKIILESFIQTMKETKRPKYSAKLVAEKFDIDVSDVEDIVRDSVK